MDFSELADGQALQLVGWGCARNWQKTGGKVKSTRTRRGNRAATALRLAAWSLLRSQSALGAYLRRLKRRLGKAAGITATAHKLARLVYWSLSKGLAYAKRTQEAYEEEQRQRVREQLEKQARRLGLEVIERPAAAAASGRGGQRSGRRGAVSSADSGKHGRDGQRLPGQSPWGRGGMCARMDAPGPGATVAWGHSHSGNSKAVPYQGVESTAG